MNVDLPKPLPRKIWILWLQGFENAPPLVKLCVKSWQRLNPDWSINLLTEDSLHHLFDDAFSDFLNQEDANGNTPVAGAIETALGDISITGPLSESLGVSPSDRLERLYEASLR